VRLARSGHLPEAVAAFSEAVRIDPTFASAQNNLGLAMAQTGRLLEAADHFRAAIRARPNFPDAQGNLAEALRRLAK
jgi:Flp pilus assembly protein TadD